MAGIGGGGTGVGDFRIQSLERKIQQLQKEIRRLKEMAVNSEKVKGK